jgi:hypothetical protein
VLTFSAINITVNTPTVTLVQFVPVGGTEPAARPVAATGGAGVLIYTISPSLPSSLTYNSNGTLENTPLILSADTVYTVTVTDEANTTATAQFNLQIVETPPQLLSVVNNNASYELELNSSNAFQPILVTGGTAPLTYRIEPETLPVGLTFDTATGFLNGTVTQTFDSSAFTVFVTDSKPTTVSGNFTLTQFVETGGSGRGPRGFTGSQGFTGSRGPLGFVGSIGDLGYTGSRGTDGYTGSIGFTGSQGITGFVGSQGLQGIQGATGFTGSQGLQGVQGAIGGQGVQGATGFVGSQGLQGTQGVTH